jgi:hypothetical protein
MDRAALAQARLKGTGESAAVCRPYQSRCEQTHGSDLLICPRGADVRCASTAFGLSDWQASVAAEGRQLPRERFLDDVS